MAAWCRSSWCGTAQRVEKGQLLSGSSTASRAPSSTFSLADRDAALAQEARLIAERDGRDEPDFADDLLRAQRRYPRSRQAMANERADDDGAKTPV